jgi:hypothetical protein
MQLAVRSYLTAGVAVASIGVLAVSPVAPPMPDIKMPAVYSSASVELTSLVNPIEEYAVVLGTTIKNVELLAQRVVANPAPILSQIVANQLASAAAIANFAQVFGGSLVNSTLQLPAQLQTAAGQLAAGDVTGALNTMLTATVGSLVGAVVETLFFQPEAFAGLQNALRQPLANLLNVVDLTSPANVGNLLGPLLAPVQLLTDVTNVVGAAGDGIFAGIKNGNPETIANAVLSFGPNLTNAILNGTTEAGNFAAGLFGPNGIVAGLLTLGDLVAKAITPPATTTAKLAATQTAINAAATTLTLAAAPEAAKVEAPKALVASAGTESAAVTGVSASAETVTTQAPAKESAASAGESETPATSETAETPKASTNAGTVAPTKKLKPAGGSARGSLKDVGEGLKKVAAGLTGKSAKPAKDKASATAGGSTGSSSGGSARGAA